MRAARALRLLLLGAAAAFAQAGPPALQVPYGQLCIDGPGPAALWRDQDQAFVIQASANPASVQRRALDDSAAAWDAAALLTGQPLATPPVPPALAPEARKIYTASLARGSATTLAFTWAALPAPMRTLLNADGQGEARVAYLRGERGRELGQPDGIFRQRESVLGDIVRSVPLIVGAPAPSGTGDGHATFREQAKARTLAVYVGANDGMLHAFAASDGAELFAYVPSALVAALAALGDPDAPARTYVDASAGQGDAMLGGSWHTVLASGMGMGARGVFALDISNPAAFAQGMGALWEFTDKDDPAIGYVHAPPQIAALNIGAPGQDPVYRYFVVVSSGINSGAVDGNGALFLLALDKQASQPWRAGVNYYRISTSGANAALPNALSAPTLVSAADGSAVLAYAGDLQGRLWRFDLGAKTAQRLFTARDEAGRAQPIAYAPKAVFAPDGGYLVLFGTGKLIEQGDLLAPSFAPQSLYAVHDLKEEPTEAVRSRAQLAQRTLAGSDKLTVTGERIDYFAPNAKRGWYADFANASNDGERVAASPSVTGGSVIFDTLVPGAAPCTAAASRLYVLDALSGLALDANGAVQPDAVTGERTASAALQPALLIEISASAGVRDATGAARASRTLAVIRPRAAGEAPAANTATTITLSFPARRMGWREVANWQELHEAANKKSN